MSVSQMISRWKEKAEIDYFPLFISLWFSAERVDERSLHWKRRS